MDRNRSTSIAKHLSDPLGLPAEIPCITKCHSCTCKTHLAASTERASSKQKWRLFGNLVSPATMDHYGSLWITMAVLRLMPFT